MRKLVVLTGLDGAGTSTVANALNHADVGSLLLHTPGPLFTRCRHVIDRELKAASPRAHYLFYLSSVMAASDLADAHIQRTGHNVYCVRYLIDSVVSHRVAGLAIDLTYETPIYRIRPPDLTIFLEVGEAVRQRRLEVRGKSWLDRVLDDPRMREAFQSEFFRLRDHFVIVSNEGEESPETIAQQILNDYGLMA